MMKNRRVYDTYVDCSEQRSGRFYGSHTAVSETGTLVPPVGRELVTGTSTASKLSTSGDLPREYSLPAVPVRCREKYHDTY